MQSLRLFMLLACLTLLVGQPGFVVAQTGAPVQIGVVSFTKVADWEAGMLKGVLVTNNDGGELRLDAGTTQAVFESGLQPLDFQANALSATWRAAVPQGTSLVLEVRAGAGGESLGDWKTLAAGDARASGSDAASALEDVIALPSGTEFLQLRATMNSTVTNASPELQEVAIAYFGTTAGPNRVAGLKPVTLQASVSTMTNAPQMIERSSWSGNAPRPTAITRQQPHGIVLHQLLNADNENPLPYLRALLNYHVKTLGWPDLPFHYMIDSSGVIYEGMAGGPSASPDRSAGEDAAIHIALLGNAAPSAEAQAALAQLMAWLGQAYGIAPLGSHAVSAADGASSMRDNIVAHSDIATAPDPSVEMRALLPNIRKAADAATVRARWYFAEGNVLNYAERLALLNPSASIANVRFILLRQPGPSVIRETTIPAGGRADLVLNDLFNDTDTVPAIVESNAPILVERYMDFESDISMTVGVRNLSRVWYFAEGATDDTNRTFLVLFNPQSAEAQITLSYIRDDGLVNTPQRINVPAGERRVIVVGDQLNGARFGMRVIANRPIVAERTVIFGPGSTLDSGGVHTTAGVTELPRRWYFAEGTTEPPFKMNIMVLNPNNQTANVAVTFMTSDGTSLTRRYAVPATTRLAINVNDVVPQLGVATTVDADRPVVAERTISWNDGRAGTAGPGATQTAYTWHFVDGRTSEGFQEFLLVNNPGRNQARVTVDYVLADGSKVSDPAFLMPAGSRQTVAVHQLHAGQAAISATVRSSQLIVVERSLYRGNPRSADNTGGETVLGIAGETR